MASALQSYAQRVADLAQVEFWNRFTPPAKETATVSVSLLPDGAVARVIVVESSSEEAHEHAVAATIAASPFPIPPPGYAACTADQPMTLHLEVDRQPECDRIPEVSAYGEDVHRRVLDHLGTRGQVIGIERVLLQIMLNSDGTVAKMSVLKSPSPEATAKAEDAVRASSPFPPPPEFTTCFSRIPVLVLLGVVTR